MTRVEQQLLERSPAGERPPAIAAVLGRSLSHLPTLCVEGVPAGLYALQRLQQL